ncbi:hypothetical protein TNCV_1064391 [Trichonephila clavipes]|nr:hypothetical protein TNCV_1064391 [Trichonephila clavipes]
MTFIFFQQLKSLYPTCCLLNNTTKPFAHQLQMWMLKTPLCKHMLLFLPYVYMLPTFHLRAPNSPKMVPFVTSKFEEPIEILFLNFVSLNSCATQTEFGHETKSFNVTLSSTLTNSKLEADFFGS